MHKHCLLLAVMATALTLVGCGKSGDTQAVAQDSTEVGQTKLIAYYSPEGLSFVKGRSGAYIYKEPNSWSPRMVELALGDYAENMWSDEADPNELEMGGSYISLNNALKLDEGDGYCKILYGERIGYVQSSKTSPTDLKYLTASDFYAFKSGPFSGMLVDIKEDMWNYVVKLGYLENGMAVYPFKAELYASGGEAHEDLLGGKEMAQNIIKKIFHCDINDVEFGSSYPDMNGINRLTDEEQIALVKRVMAEGLSPYVYMEFKTKSSRYIESYAVSKEFLEEYGVFKQRKLKVDL